MLDMDGALEARAADTPEGSPRMAPRVKLVGPGRLEVVSMGFLSGEDEAIMLRGLMLNRPLQLFLEDVDWGDLDYLLIDMPPGTGDVQMGLARMLPRADSGRSPACLMARRTTVTLRLSSRTGWAVLTSPAWQSLVAMRRRGTAGR
jgi:Mrp family chromosome partitioning ATPase